MRSTTLTITTAAGLALLLASGCEAKKSANPLSPSVAGPIPGVEITPPKLLEPAQGFKFKDTQQPIKLLIENSSSTGVRPITYTFEVATDTGFSTRLFARSAVPPGDGGRTSLQIDKLDVGRSYYWRARAEDGANTGPYAAAQFEVLPRPQLDPPAAVSPVNNERVTTLQPLFTFANSTRNSAIGLVYYEFQIARDQAFTQLVGSGFVDETPSQTKFTAPSPLQYQLTYYWHARATDGDNTSAWMTAQVFRSMALPTPSPSPSPSPSPNPGGPCVSSSPLGIVECERAKWGHMSTSDTVTFLRAVAHDLTANGISGGPFGILRKSGGTSCNGYSCDIICSGQGTAQKQWDVLGDSDGAQTPSWNGPSTYPNIRMDACEIQ